MAHFSNSSDGESFNGQCARCKYGQAPCPIAAIQMNYNYSAIGNPIASAIMMELVEKDGTCTVYEMAKSDFAIDPNQLKLFS